MPKMSIVQITKDLMEQGKSRNGSWSRKQLEALGVQWPLVKGWYTLLIGRWYDREDVELFLFLKDSHLKKVKEQKFNKGYDRRPE